MAIEGAKILKLFETHQATNLHWREKAGNYWQRFIRDAKDKGFGVKFNHDLKSIDILGEDGLPVVSLYFRKEMLREDCEVRYGLEITDRRLFEDFQVGDEIIYNGRSWKINGIKGDYVTIQHMTSYRVKRVHRNVIEKFNPDD